jgi:hypothetical protein
MTSTEAQLFLENYLSMTYPPELKELHLVDLIYLRHTRMYS